MGLIVPLIVIVIFLVIWILSNVIRAQQDAAHTAARKNSMNRKPPPKRQGGTVASDIDRFLQEIDKLRKKSDPAKSEETAARPAVDPPPRKTEKKAQESRKGRPNRTQSSSRENRPATKNPKPSESKRAPEPAPVTESSSAKPGNLTEVLEQREALALIQSPEFSQPSPIPTATKAKMAPIAEAPQLISPVLQSVLQLLRSGQGSAAALVLTEILGQPRCRSSLSSSRKNI